MNVQPAGPAGGAAMRHQFTVALLIAMIAFDAAVEEVKVGPRRRAISPRWPMVVFSVIRANTA